MQQNVNFKIIVNNGNVKDIAEAIVELVKSYSFDIIQSEEKTNARIQSWLDDMWYCVNTIGNDSEEQMYEFDFYILFPRLFEDINTKFNISKFEASATYYNDDLGVVDTYEYNN